MVQYLSPPLRRRPDEHISRARWFALLASMLAATTVWVMYDELVVRRPWKKVQAEFNRRAVGLETEPVPIGLRQIANPALGIIDRCTTCHVGINRPSLADADVPQPYRGHPGLDEGFFVAHPPRTLGCTVCHGGQGMQTKGVARAKFDHGGDDPYWEIPLRTGALVEASCFGCHSSTQVEAVAPTFAEGQRLYRQLGCSGCHESRLVEPNETQAVLKIGPPLDRVAQKHSPQFLVAWIRSPQNMRPRTRMPNSWPEPTGYDGEPLPDDHPAKSAWRVARDAEPRAIAAFLLSRAPAPLPTIPLPTAVNGDAARGRALYRNLGCPACHEEMEGQVVGPELQGVGAKASESWLHAWLAEPKAIWREATMPDFRLTAPERADLVAYLGTLRDEDDRVGAVVSGRPLAAESLTDTALITRGEALIRKYGCYGCHQIPGFETAARAGPTLVDFGTYTPDRLDWGPLERPVERDPVARWTQIKVADPRRFSRSDAPLVMPKYGLTDAQVEALTVFVLADRPRRPTSFHAPTKGRDETIARGEHMIARLGCRGCHEIGRTEEAHFDDDGSVLWIDYQSRGGGIREVYENRHLAPPTLTFGGLKLRYRWLFDYIRAPFTVRPWLAGRMPTYALSVEQTQALVAYLAAVDGQQFPFRDLMPPALSSADREDAIWLFSQMQCLKCHQPSRTDHDPAELAPDLVDAHDRLTPAWVRRWLLEPQQMEPGTRMPTFFPLADDDDPTSYTTPYPGRLGGDIYRQVDALVSLTLAYGQDPQLAEELQAKLLGDKQ